MVIEVVNEKEKVVKNKGDEFEEEKNWGQIRLDSIQTCNKRGEGGVKQIIPKNVIFFSDYNSRAYLVMIYQYGLVLYSK